MRQRARQQTGSEFSGNIINIRAVEDCIRATKKYTKGAFRSPVRHPLQGDKFPSKVLSEYYEVYPHTELGWDMPASTAIDLLWGEVMIVNVLFEYDYRANKASVFVRDGMEAVEELSGAIPGFGEALTNAVTGAGGQE